MAIYEPRLTAPSRSDKNFIHYSAGGLNRCIKIEDGSCLSNCCGYAWGRWLELLGYRHKLSTGNAENWYENTADGYKRGKEPREGAVICFRKGETFNGKDGYGHVAIVEKINADGSIVTSNSMYGGSRFYTQTLYPPLFQLNDKKYVFQGFIYLPITFESPKIETASKYTVGDYKVACEALNVRKGPGITYDNIPFKNLTKDAQNKVLSLAGKKVDGYVKGLTFTVSEVKGEWGKTPSGWVYLGMGYCKKISSVAVTIKYKQGMYRVTADVLNVRSGPGTTYPAKSYSELTADAQRQVLKCAGKKRNGYVKGVECIVLEVKGNWGKTYSGWICLEYCEKL